MSRLFRNRNIATFYLVLMCVAIIPLEGYGISNIKVAAMALAPFIILIKTPYFSKATLWGGLYFLIVFLAAYLSGHFRVSTVLYLGLFLLMFNAYYNLVISGAFSIDYFIKLLKFIIKAFTIVLFLQQLMMLIDVSYFPFFNLMGPNTSIFKLNSLSLEPSHSARILTVCFFGLLKTTEIKYGCRRSIQQLFGEYRWIIIGFLYSMVTMGSATAFVGLALISLYFLKKQYIAFIIPFSVILYFIIPAINYEPLNRVRLAFNATMTWETENVIKADQSASVRIAPLLNTLNNLDLSSKKAWFGEGTDTDVNYGLVGTKRMVGGINDYGLLSYIFLLIFIYTCCIRNFFSLETLIFILLMGAGVSNIAYGWGMLMLMSTVNYFNSNTQQQSQYYG